MIPTPLNLVRELGVGHGCSFSLSGVQMLSVNHFVPLLIRWTTIQASQGVRGLILWGRLE